MKIDLNAWEAEAKEDLVRTYDVVAGEALWPRRILALIELIKKKDCELSILSQFEPGNLQPFESVLFTVKEIAREALALTEESND